MPAYSRRTLLTGSMALAAMAAVSQLPGARLVRAQSGAAYEIVDFGAMTDGALPEGYARPIFGDVNGITNDGTVFGRIAVSEEKLSPALWDTNGKLKRLKSGKYGGQVRAVNAAGDAAGAVYESIGGIGENSFNLRQQPAAWIGGELVELPAPDPEFSSTERSGEALGISDDGMIVGRANGYALRWVNGEPQILPEPESGGIEIAGCNAAGVIAARQYDFSGSEAVYTLGRIDGDQFNPVAVPDGLGNPSPVAISESGLLLARGFPADVWLGVLSEGNEATTIDFRESGGSFMAISVNDAADVIGGWQPFAGVVFEPAIWRSGELVTLSSLMPADSGLSSLSVTGINNDGMICGSAYDADFAEHLILLVPAE
jgi:hypothetical protein